MFDKWAGTCTISVLDIWHTFLCSVAIVFIRRLLALVHAEAVRGCVGAEEMICVLPADCCIVPWLCVQLCSSVPGGHNPVDTVSIYYLSLNFTGHLKFQGYQHVWEMKDLILPAQHCTAAFPPMGREQTGKFYSSQTLFYSLSSVSSTVTMKQE